MILSLKIGALTQLFESFIYATWPCRDFDVIILADAAKINSLKLKRNTRVKWDSLETRARWVNFPPCHLSRLSISPMYSVACTLRISLARSLRTRRRIYRTFGRRAQIKISKNDRPLSAPSSHEWKVRGDVWDTRKNPASLAFKVRHCYCWSCANISNGRQMPQIYPSVLFLICLWSAEIGSWTICMPSWKNYDEIAACVYFVYMYILRELPTVCLRERSHQRVVRIKQNKIVCCVF